MTYGTQLWVNPKDPFTEIFFKEQMHEAILVQNQRDRGHMEQINKGHTQHEHDEETDVQCHCCAEENKHSHI